MLNEENIIIKNPLEVDINLASVYPNLYRTAMSSLGYQIIYGMVNAREDSFCERVIYPNHRSIETNTPLSEFDIVSFTIQYEQDYFNVLKILKASNIPLKVEDRLNEKDNSYPLIIAGGPCISSNPLPLADFVDLFIIGEGEVVLDKFLDKFKTLNNPKKEIESFLDIEGIYLYDKLVKRMIVSDMDDAFHLNSPIVTKTDESDFKPALGNSILLNVSRGCFRSCKFCMSGYLYRPMRETSLNKLLNTAIDARDKTGLNKISLVAPSVSDYSQIDELSKKLLDLGFDISMPSLRIESITKETLENLKESGAKSITLAPESIYTLRKRLNKDINDEKIFQVIEEAFKLNFNIKFYFLIGIPGENMVSIEELVEYIKYINTLKNSITPKSKIKFSVNPLIPKSHTPFQWMGYDIKDIKKKIRLMKKELKNFDIKFDSPKMGLIQYVLSTKGREIGELIQKSIPDILDKNNFDDLKIDIKQWNQHSKGYKIEDDLPWKNIDIGIKESFFKKQYEQLLNDYD
ncbi:radical SAM protein [Methanobrevibacter curvatus]|uniref:Ribosomal protein S12 methylthiotransferase RimO n=1 Tax=Methanobrevibacter curvatus TaxID=49547 RepID=A0A162FFM5_9EURY|nr:radical SAM protein [Methanobrevibacter curvatus]KZX12375.1 ribosomal protein S12 methylthiotransferase RimO [Methanobrevibacter curvatus]